MLETLPEINDRCFALPRVNSLKAIQAQAQETKPNFQNMGSGNFDWACFVNPGPEFVSGNQVQAPTTQQQGGMISYRPSNDVFTPAAAQQVKLGNSLVEEEVQSGLRTSHQGGRGVMQQNSGLLTQNFVNMVEPYGFRYPTQRVGFGYRQ